VFPWLGRALGPTCAGDKKTHRPGPRQRLCAHLLLNEIEPVWGHLKEDYFSQMLVRSPRQFVDEAVAFLTTLSKPGALRNTLKPRKRKSMGKKFRRVA
jgi:hypothetical protein